MSSVNLPDSLVSIAAYGFGYCSALKTLQFPNGPTVFNNYCFYYCSGLTSIYIPAYYDSENEKTLTLKNYTITGSGSSLVIYCEYESKPSSWESSWNSDGRFVAWNYDGEEHTY
jgi:hypothetical protein